MTEPRLLREKVLVFFSFFFIKVNQRTRPLMTSLFRLEFDLISFSFSGRGYKSLGGWGRGGGGSCTRNRVKIYQIKYLELHTTMTPCDSMSSRKQFFTVEKRTNCFETALQALPN